MFLFHGIILTVKGSYIEHNLFLFIYNVQNADENVLRENLSGSKTRSILKTVYFAALKETKLLSLHYITLQRQTFFNCEEILVINQSLHMPGPKQ